MAAAISALELVPLQIHPMRGSNGNGLYALGSNIRKFQSGLFRAVACGPFGPLRVEIPLCP
jgi:hypothetical protein